MFEQYCLEHNIRLPKELVDKEAILASPDMIDRIGQMCKEFPQELQWLVDARISKIREYLVLEALPVEVMELRYAILEVASIEKDALYYAEKREALLAMKEKESEDNKNNPSEADTSSESVGTL